MGPKIGFFGQKAQNRWGKCREWSKMLFLSILDRLEPLPTHSPHFFDFFTKFSVFEPILALFDQINISKSQFQEKFEY